MAPALLAAILGVASATLNFDTELAKGYIDFREGLFQSAPTPPPAPPPKPQPVAVVPMQPTSPPPSRYVQQARDEEQAMLDLMHAKMETPK